MAIIRFKPTSDLSHYVLNGISFPQNKSRMPACFLTGVYEVWLSEGDPRNQGSVCDTQSLSGAIAGQKTHVTLDHKTSRKGPFCEIEIYKSSES